MIQYINRSPNLSKRRISVLNALELKPMPKIPSKEMEDSPNVDNVKDHNIFLRGIHLSLLWSKSLRKRCPIYPYMCKKRTNMKIRGKP
jgi:hypothetical protein